jgi:hypothetical protein
MRRLILGLSIPTIVVSVAAARWMTHIPTIPTPVKQAVQAAQVNAIGWNLEPPPKPEWRDFQSRNPKGQGNEMPVNTGYIEENSPILNGGVPVHRPTNSKFGEIKATFP